MPNLPFVQYNTSLTDYAKINRKNPTKAEGIMWHMILKKKKLLGYKFRRQKIIGSFILDFYCSKLLLGIELDGGYHNERVSYDEMRDNIIKDHGIQVIRFTNTDVEKNGEGVMIELERIIKERENRLSIK